MTPISLTAYAKLRGVSPVAVSKAVARGRLHDSVVRDERGAPKIADPDLADREWTANTRQRADRPPGPSGSAPPDPPPVAAEHPAARRRDSADPPDGVPPYAVSQAVRAAAAARREAALAGIAEIELEQKRGSVVPVAEVRAEVIERYSLVKTRLLAVPSAVGQRLPDIAVRVVAVVDELVRDALEELASDGITGEVDRPRAEPDGRDE